MTETTYAPRSYEELLMGRVGKLYEAKEEGNGYLFDEVLDEIEGLFGLIPELYAIFATKKAEYSTDATSALQQLSMQTKAIDDDITRDVIDAQKKATIQWEYRSDMLDIIVAIINDYQMIPFSTPFTSQMSLGELSPEEEEAEFEPEFEPEPESEPEPKPVPKQIAEPVEPAPIQNPQPTPAPTPAPVPAPAPVQPEQPPQPQETQIRKKIKFTAHPNKNE